MMIWVQFLIGIGVIIILDWTWCRATGRSLSSEEDMGPILWPIFSCLALGIAAVILADWVGLPTGI